jgi:hypothetical protein
MSKKDAEGQAYENQAYIRIDIAEPGRSDCPVKC